MFPSRNFCEWIPLFLSANYSVMTSQLVGRTAGGMKWLQRHTQPSMMSNYLSKSVFWHRLYVYRGKFLFLENYWCSYKSLISWRRLLRSSYLTMRQNIWCKNTGFKNIAGLWSIYGMVNASNQIILLSTNKTTDKTTSQTTKQITYPSPNLTNSTSSPKGKKLSCN